jgi:hypothetical protein
MLEDEWLKWKLRHGSLDAVARVYERYVDAMLTPARIRQFTFGDYKELVERRGH